MPNNINCIGTPLFYCVYNNAAKTLTTAFKLESGNTLIDNSPELQQYDSYCTDNRQALLNFLSTNQISINNLEIPE